MKTIEQTKPDIEVESDGDVDVLLERIDKNLAIEKDLVEGKIKPLLKEAQPLRRRLQDYRGEKINGEDIEVIHNKITALTSKLEGVNTRSYEMMKKAEELRIILRDIKTWLAEKSKKTR